jgi:hypothetical protein
MDLEVGFVDVPALARAASRAVTPLAQRLPHHGQQLRLPLPDALVADSDGLSIGRLVDFLTALGCDVEIRHLPTRNGAPGRVRVRELAATAAA